MGSILQVADSDGVVHNVCFQREPNTCAIACLYMVQCAVTGQAPVALGYLTVWEAARAEVREEQRRLQGPSSTGGSGVAPSFPYIWPLEVKDKSGDIAVTDFGFGDGTSGSTILATAKRLGFPMAQLTIPSGIHPGVDARLLKKGPAILAFTRLNSTLQHVVVAARVTNNGNLVIIDPAPNRRHSGVYERSNGGKVPTGEVYTTVYHLV